MNCIICTKRIINDISLAKYSSPIMQGECCNVLYRFFANETSIARRINENYSCEYWSKDDMTEIWFFSSDFNNWKVIAEIQGDKLLYLSDEKLLETFEKMKCLL